MSRKICTNNIVYEKGDTIWYRRKDEWRGPAKVMFQDGKVVLIKHGEVVVRVSVNRIVRKKESLSAKPKRKEMMRGQKLSTLQRGRQAEIRGTRPLRKDRKERGIQTKRIF